jgi:light-regulated signal transduction histidine kinase (bacteriophytochrome)
LENFGAGWVQSYGVMIVVGEEEYFKVQACSANSLDLLGIDYEQIVGSCLYSFFDGEDLKKLKGICEQQSSSFLNPSLINIGIPGGPKVKCSLIASRK